MSDLYSNANCKISPILNPLGSEYWKPFNPKAFDGKPVVMQRMPRQIRLDPATYRRLGILPILLAQCHVPLQAAGRATAASSKPARPAPIRPGHHPICMSTQKAG